MKYIYLPARRNTNKMSTSVFYTLKYLNMHYMDNAVHILSPMTLMDVLSSSPLPTLPLHPLKHHIKVSPQSPKLVVLPFISKHLIFSTLSKSLHNSGFCRGVTVRLSSNVNWPLVSPEDQWGTWTALFSIGAFGLWSEKTKIGSRVSAALVSTLVALMASNMGIIPYDAPAYTVVYKFLLPLTVPLLLFKADLRHVVKSTGTLLCAFLLGSVGTIVGTLVAYKLVPMRTLGQDSWKIAAALMGSYIGGAVNFVAISEILGVSPSVLTAGLAVDNVICAIYFMFLVALGSNIPSESPSSTTKDVSTSTESELNSRPLTLHTAAPLAASFVICKIATSVAIFFGVKGADLPAITVTVIVLATLLPKHFAYLAPAGDMIAMVLMQVFFAVVGASGSIKNVITTAPNIFIFAFIQVSVHLAVILGLGKLFRFDLKLLLLASNANIGGPTTAGGMARTKGWGSLVAPAVLAGIFGIAIATFLGVSVGTSVLMHM